MRVISYETRADTNQAVDDTAADLTGAVDRQSADCPLQRAKTNTQRALGRPHRFCLRVPQRAKTSRDYIGALGTVAGESAKPEGADDHAGCRDHQRCCA